MLSYAFELGASNAFFDERGRLSGGLSVIPSAREDIPYYYSVDIADETAITITAALIFLQGDTAIYEGNSSDPGRYEWSDNPFFNKRNPTASYFSNFWNTRYSNYNETIIVSDSDYSFFGDVHVGFKVGTVLYSVPVFTMNIFWNGFGKTTYCSYGNSTRSYQSYAQRTTSVTNNNDVNLLGFNQANYNNKVAFSGDGLTVNSRGLQIKNNAGQVVFDADTDGNLRIKGHLDGATGTFSGQLDAASGQFIGEIVADSGKIGNWEIEDDFLKTQLGSLTLQLGKGTMANGAPGIGLVYSLSNGDYLVYNDGGIYYLTSSWSMRSKVEVGNNSVYILCSDSDAYIQITSNNDMRISATRYLDLWGKITTIDGDELDIDSDLVKVDNPPWFNNVASTTSGSNTVLVAGTYGRKLYVTSSLRALKKNIKTIENPSEKVDNLRGVSFTSKCEVDDPKRVFYGFIAEEVEQAVPELATYEDGKLQSVQYDRVCALLVEDNKAMHKRISALEKQVEALESMIKELKK